jgi:hypothetical protein
MTSGRATVPARRHLGRAEGTNFAIYSERRHGGRALPLRVAAGRGADALRSPARTYRARLARLPAGRRSRAALRLPGQRPVRARPRAPLQSVQAPDRPVRQGARRRIDYALPPLRLPLRPAGRGLGAGRRERRRRRAQGRGDRSRVRLAGRPPPRHPWHRTVIYEAHVKGSRCSIRRSEELRGTYAAVAHPAVIEHLKSLGVTALELLPVHEIVDDLFLIRRGLRNYWGYNNIGYFAPAGRYAHGPRVPRAGARVQGDGAPAARGRDRGDPGRRLQSHRRREPPRSDPFVPRHRQPDLLPPGTRQPGSTWTTRAAGTR